MTQSHTLIGTTFGAYEVQALVGSGGMAHVYRGRDRNLERLVAIKILPTALLQHPDMVARLWQEARLLARLNHPHIVQVYDVGEQHGAPYMIQELLPGPTLRQYLDAWPWQQTPLPRDQVLAITTHLASALNAAHAAGVIHRDVKPANAMFNAAGNIVLTDFGIARALHTDIHHTQPGTVIGTPAYSSPEQAQGEPLTPASDVYALGVVVYELLTGSVPFVASGALGVLTHHIHTPPPLVRATRPSLPPAVEAVVQRALAKDPATRFASAGAFASALAQAWPDDGRTWSGLPIDIHQQPTVVHGDGAPVPALSHTPLQVRPSRRFPPRALVILAVLAVLLGVGLSWVATHQTLSQAAPPPSSPAVLRPTSGSVVTSTATPLPIPTATQVPRQGPALPVEETVPSTTLAPLPSPLGEDAGKNQGKGKGNGQGADKDPGKGKDDAPGANKDHGKDKGDDHPKPAKP